ncbi:MAG TPA: hypothetical protein VKD69_22495, partial [Vicinamibacterales bacterium]|nr:hypothetical protein [Vicinamibacterales bacterium]
MEPVFLTGGRRRRRVACAVAAFFVALALLIDRRAIINATRFPNDDHASASLDQAVNLAFCRATGVLSATFNPSRHLRNHPEDLALGMSDLIVTHAGSVRQYCDGLTY